MVALMTYSLIKFKSTVCVGELCFGTIDVYIRKEKCKSHAILCSFMQNMFS